jgi:UDP-N-acetylmuramyl pentapeptide phosphotransferase/UDP-N-acetylglucosamine-1-phosphate transferase
VRLLLAAIGAAASASSARSAWPKALERTNFRGRTVTLGGGPALAASASVTAALGARDVRSAAAMLTAGLGSGAVGLYDDIVGNRPEQKAYKGFRGHVRGLREGRVTSGMLKVAGVGAAALAASALLPGNRKLVDVALGAGVIAGMANLVNLLDLRPGRALKSGIAVGAPLMLGEQGELAAGPVGAAAGLLPQDLGERVMLGDSGANALGALLGTAVAARRSRLLKVSVLAVLAGLTYASEKVSFTKVIERTPALRAVDEWGRHS